MIEEQIYYFVGLAVLLCGLKIAGVYLLNKPTLLSRSISDPTVKFSVEFLLCLLALGLFLGTSFYIEVY